DWLVGCSAASGGIGAGCRQLGHLGGGAYGCCWPSNEKGWRVNLLMVVSFGRNRVGKSAGQAVPFRRAGQLAGAHQGREQAAKAAVWGAAQLACKPLDLVRPVAGEA